MRTSLKLIAATVAVGVAVLGSAAANANPIYFLYSLNGGASYTQFGVSDGSTIGQANTSVGGFTISAQATGSPLLTAPNFTSGTIDVSSSTAGTLKVAIQETGLTSPAITGFSLGWTNVNGGTVPVTETFAIVNSSGTYTALASQTLVPNTATATLVPYTTTPNYTIVEIYSATFGAGGGNFNATISETGVSSVPEPMSMSLLGAGLVGLGIVRLRRKSV